MRRNLPPCDLSDKPFEPRPLVHGPTKILRRTLVNVEHVTIGREDGNVAVVDVAIGLSFARLAMYPKRIFDDSTRKDIHPDPLELRERSTSV